MPSKKTHYLIDLENVGETGLSGGGSLSANAYVHLFSTKHAAKLSTATLATFNLDHMSIHEVPEGNQSADMHLVTYLGYLIGREGTSSTYVVVSKDTDFDNIVTFWKDEAGANVRRQPQLKAKQRQSAPKPSPTPSKSKALSTRPKTQQALAKPQPKQALKPKEKVALNTAVLQAVAKAKYDSETAGKVASIVAKNYAGGERKKRIHNAIVAELGPELGQSIYGHIKHLL